MNGGHIAIAMILLGLMLLAPRAFGQDREAQKDALRLQATEFCAAVGQPPAILRDAINNALAQDPKTWLPIAQWWNRIVEKYEKARCGDA